MLAKDARKELQSFTKLKINCAEDLRKLPLESGIYAVIHTHTGRVFYIGKSVKLRTRWYAKSIEMIPKEHQKSYSGEKYHSHSSIFWKPHKMLYHVLELGCDISYKLYPKLEAAHLELDLINTLKPYYNVQLV